MIKNFLMLSVPLNETYLPAYNTTKGREYTLVNRTWPTDWLTEVNEWIVRIIVSTCFLPLSSTGQIYIETLESVKKSFPQYLDELQGVAHGADVEFHKVIHNKKK